MKYELLLFVHVLAAIVWVGSVVCVNVIALRLVRRNDFAGLTRFASDAEPLSKVVGTAALLLLVAGVLLVEELGLSYTTPWVMIGLAGYLASMIVGGVLAGREGKRAEALVAQGDEGQNLTRAVKRTWLFARVDVLILVIVVWAMTWKPG